MARPRQTRGPAPPRPEFPEVQLLSHPFNDQVPHLRHSTRADYKIQSDAPVCIGLDQVQVQPSTQRPDQLRLDLMKNSVLNITLVIT